MLIMDNLDFKINEDHAVLLKICEQALINVRVKYELVFLCVPHCVFILE